MSSANISVSSKNFLAIWLFSLFLGWLGADRFYRGNLGLGFLKLVTFGGFGIWALIDLILILTGSMKDKDGRLFEGYEANKNIAWIVTGILAVLSFGFGVLGGAFGGMMTGWGGMMGSGY
jgi:TM2 domain-containing membrane protein YozV